MKRWTRMFGPAAVVSALALVAPAPTNGVAQPAPVLVGRSTPALAPGSRYVVKRGDSLGSIATRAGVKRSDLASLNGIVNPNLVRLGETLTIPGPGVPATTAAPSRATGPGGAPTLRLGSVGDAVRDLQQRLRAAGHAVQPDGSFGARTAVAVQAFQRVRKLPGDGVVGSQTWIALGAAPAPARLPSTPDPTPSTAGPWRAFGAGSYTTKAGDTWAGLAKARGTTAEALAAANQRRPADRPAPGTVLAVPGGWRCPVPGGSFINDWGFPRRGHTHQGTDLFAPRGRPVLAPVDGDAEQQPNGLGGNAVQLRGNDGVRYYFAHLDAYGATGRVRAGTAIGTVGNSGDARTTVTHLHFEVHPGGGAAVNPYPTLLLACRR